MNNKLDKFYKSYADNPEMMSEEKWREVELDTIKEEIGPQIVLQMESLLNRIKCPLSISVEYSENGTVSVEFARSGKKEEQAKSEIRKDSRSASVGFTVRFPDGRLVDQKKAKDTFINTLRNIGLNRVAGFNSRTFAGTRLVTRAQRKDGNAKWQEYVDGWYVYVNMSNKTKIDVLRELSDYLKENLIIETKDGKTVSDTDTTRIKGKRQKFLLDGYGPLNKCDCVWETVSKYMKQNPLTTSQQLQKTFPANIQGSYGVVRNIQWVQEQQRAGKDFMSRYFTIPDKVIKISDGEQMVVCNQWGHNFDRFIEKAKEHGFDIVKSDL